GRASRPEEEGTRSLAPVEIRSGAIIHQELLVDGSYFYTIQANTIQGLRIFADARELLGRQVCDPLESGFSRSVTWWTGWTPAVVAGLTFSLGSSSRVAEEEAEPSAAEILAALTSHDLPVPRQRELILAAEVLRFDNGQSEALKPLLRRYID